MELDIAASTVTIAGQAFPAVGIICPDDVEAPRTDWERLLGDIGITATGNVEVYVPCESGAIIEVADLHTSLEVHLYAPVCRLDPIEPYPVWIPHLLGIVHGQLEPLDNWRRTRGVPWYWEGCEADWVAEHIVRIARMPVVMPPGPRVQPVPLTEVARLWREAKVSTP